MRPDHDIDVEQRLRRLQTLTDTGLSRLRGDELTDELLERARAVLGTDTAVVLLLDRHAQQLAVIAAKGLEGEVRRRIRIPVGAGFAGRVALTAGSVTVEEVTEADVTSPILLAAGVRSLLGVPMFAGGEVIGVLHVGTCAPRRFTDEDVRLLELVADRIGAATVAGTRGLDRTAALALQRSLLPTRLPRLPGLDLAARYVPGHEAGVGGDWYDLFTLPGDRLGLVIGDVSGHGLAAAVVMGRLRSALRAYALTSDDPAAVLTHLDRKLHHFEAGSLATVAYAVISPDRTVAHLSLAGHLPPVLAVPGRPAAPVTAPVDAPLGLWPSRPARRTTAIGLPPGALLVCYTDGLIERRDEIIDDGIDRLAAAIQPGSAEETCSKIMALHGLEQPADDIAMVAVHRRS